MKRAALLLVLLSACGEDTSSSLTSTSALPAAALSLTVETSPVTTTADPLMPLMAQWRVGLRNDGGVAARISFVNSTLRDAQSGAQARPRGALSLGADEVIALAGSDRLPAGGALTVPCSLSFLLPSGGREAVLTVAVQILDDNNHLVSATAETRVR